MPSVTVRNVLAASALAEATTGVVLALAPAAVTALLFGAEASGQWTPFARIAGVAILGLGLACWPSADATVDRSGAVRAMLAYNPLVAAYLVHLATIGVAGILLWPAVAEHASVTVLLLVAWRNESAGRASGTTAPVS